jgi:hypothetical protein
MANKKKYEHLCQLLNFAVQQLETNLPMTVGADEEFIHRISQTISALVNSTSAELQTLAQPYFNNRTSPHEYETNLNEIKELLNTINDKKINALLRDLYYAIEALNNAIFQNEIAEQKTKIISIINAIQTQKAQLELPAFLQQKLADLAKPTNQAVINKQHKTFLAKMYLLAADLWDKNLYILDNTAPATYNFDNNDKICELIIDFGKNNLLKLPAFNDIIEKLAKPKGVSNINYSIHEKNDQHHITNFNNILGQGANAKVYQAIECSHNDGNIALRPTVAKISGKNKEFLELEEYTKTVEFFKQEVENTKLFYHTAEVVETDDKLIMFMEEIPGETLDKANIPRDLPTVLDLALQIAEFINRMHNPADISKALIHSDIKFQNFKLNQDEKGHYHIYLFDFGLSLNLQDLLQAKHAPLKADKDALFSLKEFQGSPHYLAPELFQEQSAIGLKSETYALLPIFLKLFGVAPQEPIVDNIRGKDQKKQLRETAFASTGLLENLTEIPVVKIDDIDINIKLLIKTFLERMGNKADHTKRPDDNELVIFFKTFKHFINLNNQYNKNLDNNNLHEQYSCLAKLHILAAGRWYEPLLVQQHTSATPTAEHYIAAKFDFVAQPDVCKDLIKYYQPKLATYAFRQLLEDIKKHMDNLLNTKIMNYSHFNFKLETKSKNLYEIVQELLINIRGEINYPLENAQQELVNALNSFTGQHESINKQLLDAAKSKIGRKSFFSFFKKAEHNLSSPQVDNFFTYLQRQAEYLPVKSTVNKSIDISYSSPKVGSTPGT